MKKNVKGFTLIELLAVIVILAVIALIATPIIMGVINDAKEGANKDAAYGVTHAVETAIAVQMAKDPSFAPDCTTAATISNGTVTACGVTATFKGTAPTAVSIVLDSKNAATAGTTVTFSGGKAYEMNAAGEFSAKTGS